MDVCYTYTSSTEAIIHEAITYPEEGMLNITHLIVLLHKKIKFLLWLFRLY